MRTLLLVSLFLISNVLLAQPYNPYIKSLPRNPQVVNDYGDFLSGSEENNLRDELVSYRKRSGNAIVIISLSSLPLSLSVEETALQYFNKWGIGDRKKNNGVLILLCKSPRQVRITTGSGIDDILTNDDCQRIIDGSIVSNFKWGRFYAGLKEGVKDIEAALGGGGIQSSRLHSGSTVQTPAQAQNQPVPEQQPQPLTQNTSSNIQKYKPPTVGQSILGMLMIALFVWLRVKYVRSKGQGDTGNNISDYLNATGWVFLWMLKIFWWTLVACFAIFAIFFGVNAFKKAGFRRSEAASFGGGSSNGGGATGSW